MNLARGLRPIEERPTLKFAEVLHGLPRPPGAFGHYNLLHQPWGMLGNDHLGDCVVAGACHETMVLGAMAGNTIAFDDAHTIADYRAAQGNPPWPFNDHGLDMIKFAGWRRMVGIHDSRGIRHRIDAYAELTSINQLVEASYYLGVAGVGLNLPASAEKWWAELQPWTDTSESPSGEGHYVCHVGRNSRGFNLIVTWGRLQAVSDDFLEKYKMCYLAYLSREQLNSQGFSPNQYDAAKLQSFLAALGGTVNA